MVNWNSACGYVTNRQVKILDWRLGVINYSLLFAIFSYVIIYNIVFQQGYRQAALDVVGSVKMNLLKPSPAYYFYANASVFCSESSIVPAPVITPKHPCRFYDTYDAVDPGLEPSALFVSTRVKESVQSLDDGCELTLPTPACEYLPNASLIETYYIGNVEMMTLSIDHSFVAPSIGVYKAAGEMTGSMVAKTPDGKTVVIDPRDGEAAGA